MALGMQKKEEEVEAARPGEPEGDVGGGCGQQEAMSEEEGKQGWTDRKAWETLGPRQAADLP